MKNVLICCEESQTVCKAFRARGFNAFSNDIQLPSGGCPQWHILGDSSLLLDGGSFITLDGKMHFVQSWDLIIAHPPCTYLSNAGSCRLVINGMINPDRFKKGLAARDFFMMFYNCSCPHVAIENPIPNKRFNLPSYDQIIQPFYFGEKYYKTTCLWLRDLPQLTPTNIVENPIPTTYASWWNSGSRSERQKNRSKTFPGIAFAMAAQWGDFLLTDYRQYSFF